MLGIRNKSFLFISKPDLSSLRNFSGAKLASWESTDQNRNKELPKDKDKDKDESPNDKDELLRDKDESPQDDEKRISL